MAATLIEMTELWRSRPGLDAAPHQVARWYERKALLHEHLAAETTGMAQVRELEFAAAAWEHARGLWQLAALSEDSPEYRQAALVCRRAGRWPLPVEAPRRADVPVGGVAA